MDLLKWEYYKTKNDDQSVASLYTQGNVEILDVFIGNNFYYTESSGKISFLRPCIQISYDKAIEALESKIDYLNSSQEQREQIKLESACKIIEDRVKNQILNYFLSNLE